MSGTGIPKDPHRVELEGDAAFFAALGAREQSKKTSRAQGGEDGQLIPTGERHEASLALAGALRRKGAGFETILAALVAYSSTQFVEPHTEEELRVLAKSVCDLYDPTPPPVLIYSSVARAAAAAAQALQDQKAYEAAQDAPRGSILDGEAPALEGGGEVLTEEPEVFGFSGDRLRATRLEPVPISPVEGMVDPSPHLHLLIAKPKVGKSRLALWLAQRWAMGLPPWEGADPIPAGRVLILSVEQTVKIVDRVLVDCQPIDDASWEDEITIVSRHPTTSPREKRAFVLDNAGLAVLCEELRAAQDGARPYTLVVIDSLSRIKPPGCDENSNDGMTAWMQALETVADTFQAWIFLIHHEGHSGREGAVSQTRGASAITALPQVVWHLDRIKDAPTSRRLAVSGNSITSSTIDFEVCNGRVSKPDAINYWKRSEVSIQYIHAGAVLAQDTVYNVTEIARLIAKKEVGSVPSRVERAHAWDVVQHWVRTNQIHMNEARNQRTKHSIRLRCDVIGPDGQPVSAL
jgi:hypothetical protein